MLELLKKYGFYITVLDIQIYIVFYSCQIFLLNIFATDSLKRALPITNMLEMKKTFPVCYFKNQKPNFAKITNCKLLYGPRSLWLYSVKVEIDIKSSVTSIHRDS